MDVRIDLAKAQPMENNVIKMRRIWKFCSFPYETGEKANHSNAVHTVVEEQHTLEPELFLGPVQVLNMDAADVGSRDWISTVKVGETNVKFKLDSGAKGNIQLMFINLLFHTHQ